MFKLKKCSFQKKPYNVCSKFQWEPKYEKTTNFNLELFYFIQNDKALLNHTEH